jgi:tetratricopeptide (TPR) repeat protein
VPPTTQAFVDWYRAGMHGDGAGALRAARRLDALRPNGDPLLRGYAAIGVNRPREAVEAYGKIDPRGAWGEWPTYWDRLTLGYHLLGEHRHELAVARRGRERFPTLHTLRDEVRARAALGDVAAVDRLLDESLAPALAHTGPPPGQLMFLAAVELHAHGYRDAARAAANRAVRWWQERPAAERSQEGPRGSLAGALVVAGRWREAGPVVEALARERPDNANHLGLLALVAAQRGDRAEAAHIAARLATLRLPDSYASVPTLWRARIAAALGDRDRAVALLREAFAQGMQFGAFPTLHADPGLVPLRGYPPFEALRRPQG